MWTDRYSFLTGAVATPAFGLLALADDSIDATSIPHSQIVFWQAGNWGNSGQVNFTVVSVSICTHPIKQMIAVGPFGEAFLTGAGEMHEEKVESGDDTPSKRGMLRSVRGIGGRAYAAGMNRQVYRRDERGLWTCIDLEMRPAKGQVVGFESIDGFGPGDLYAVGWEGEIWHFDSAHWHQADSPTNFVLTDVCCAADGNVYACGRRGTLLMGRDDRWRVIDHGSMTEDIWSLAWLKGHLYAATYRGLFRLDGGKLNFVEIGEDPPSTYFRLSATQDVMWSIGSKDVMAFDGIAWKRVD
jgi:hypothetical protein